MFAKKLNEYCILLGCTGKELSDYTGLSPAVISRYRSGERVPALESKQLNDLVEGIEELAKAKGISGITFSTVLDRFREALASGDDDNAAFADRLNQLITILDISVRRLAQHMNYDASYISRIKSGQRSPANKETFADGVCSFIIQQYREDADRDVIAALISCPSEEIREDFTLFKELKTWLCGNFTEQDRPLDSFLHKLDTFDLNEYIRAIRFNELKIPTMPFHLPVSKNYYGLEEMKKAELDFFKATVLSSSKEQVFMCSDMPMEDMLDDTFPKKWMFGIAMMIKKGLRLNMVHNVNRPFTEMMLGLEGWIPLYMTGQVTPYYLKGVQNKVYCHSNYVSGTVALIGDCIAGAHDKGRQYLTKRKDEVAFYREKASLLLRKASPLMEIYREMESKAFSALLYADAQKPGNRRNILYAPPIYTLSDTLLEKILEENHVSAEDRVKIQTYKKASKENHEMMLSHSCVTDIIPVLSQKEFSEYPVALSLSGLFYEKDIVYSYENYMVHLRETKERSAEAQNYSVNMTAERGFRNIQFAIHEGVNVVISKSNVPAIHFAIYHPQMRSAIEHMVIPVVEEY